VQVISDLDDEDESRMVNAPEDEIVASSEAGLMDVSTTSSVASPKESCELHLSKLPQADSKKDEYKKSTMNLEPKMAETLVDGEVVSSGDDHEKATPVKAVESAYIKDFAVVSGLEQIESVFRF
jgi:hypothetical protein